MNRPTKAIAALYLFVGVISAASIGHFNSLSPFVPYIINGRNATEFETPYQIALFFNGSSDPHCGGSLIGERTVLTAAHCVSSDAQKKHPEEFMVRYGTIDKFHGIDAKVVKVIPHPLFNLSTIDYDISVIHLEKPFKKSSKATIIQMATEDPFDGSHVSVTGWGMVSGK